MEPAETPVVFVHGLWLHATSWDPWVEFFKEAGYAPVAPGWPGDADTAEETRSHPEQVAGKGINDVVEHYAGIIRGLSAPPIVIGHSFGGLIAQRLLGQNLAAAGVAIDAAPIKGVFYLPPSALRVASIALAQARQPGAGRVADREPVPLRLREPADRAGVLRAVRPLDHSLAGQAVVRGRPGQLHPHLAGGRGHPQQGPRPAAAHRGGHDHTVPAAITTATRKLYHKSPAITDFREFPDRGHSLTIDHGWRDIAQAALDWLRQRHQ